MPIFAPNDVQFVTCVCGKVIEELDATFIDGKWYCNECIPDEETADPLPDKPHEFYPMRGFERTARGFRSK
jgi:hypothetical protein